MASHFLTGTGGQRDINGPLIESSFTLCNPHRSPSCPLTMYISRQVKDHRLLTDQKHVYLNRNRHGRSSDFPPASPLATVTTTAESSHRRGTTTFQSTGWTPRSLAPRQLRRRTRQRPRRSRGQERGNRRPHRSPTLSSASSTTSSSLGRLVDTTPPSPPPARTLPTRTPGS